VGEFFSVRGVKSWSLHNLRCPNQILLLGSIRRVGNKRSKPDEALRMLKLDLQQHGGSVPPFKGKGSKWEELKRNVWWIPGGVNLRICPSGLK